MSENAVKGCRVIHSTFGLGVIQKIINRDIGPPLISIIFDDSDKLFGLHSLADPQYFTEVELPPSLHEAIAPIREARRLEIARRAEAERQRLAEQEARARQLAMERQARETRTTLLRSIATTLGDYRGGEIEPITPDHVDRWIRQFEKTDQLTILQEMDRIFKLFYFSRARVRQSVRDYIQQQLIGSANPTSVLERTQFLQIQKKGSSQKDLLRIADSVLQEDYGVSIDQCGAHLSDTFVYVDDAVYTGNRLRYDLSGQPPDPAWITRRAPTGCTLKIFVLASHTAGERYAMGHVRAAASGRVKVETLFAVMSIANQRSSGVVERFECLWPQEIGGHAAADSYVSKVRKKIASSGWSDQLFRPSNAPRRERLFSSSGARNTVERAFLTRGAELVISTGVESMRPLGWEKLLSLGFGTLLVTYRNIANNTPPVLWWAAGGWYPLFRRKDSVSPDDCWM